MSLFAIIKDELSGEAAKYAVYHLRFWLRARRGDAYARAALDIIQQGESDAVILEALRVLEREISQGVEQQRKITRADSRVEDIREMLPPRPARYLDIGNSVGDITAAIVQYYGLAKNSAFSLEPNWKGRDSGAPFILARGEAEAMPWADGSFDLVTAFMSFHHFSDIPLAMSEVARVCAPKAVFIMREHSVDPKTAPAMASFLDVMHAFHSAVFVEETSPDSCAGADASYAPAAQWQQLAQSAGLTAIAAKYTNDMYASVYLAFQAP